MTSGQNLHLHSQDKKFPLQKIKVNIAFMRKREEENLQCHHKEAVWLRK
jgi:hypothetical protein